MKKPIPFSTISREILDSWLQTSPDRPVRSEAVYRTIVDRLSFRMRLSVMQTCSSDPMDWHLRTIHHLGFRSRLIDLQSRFDDSTLGAFADRDYVNLTVVPRYSEILMSQKPVMEPVRTRVFGVVVGYDRLLLPQKNRTRPEWILSLVYGRYLCATPPGCAEIDMIDEQILQMLSEGSGAREVAEKTELSQRTIEHRIEKLKARFGSRNIVQLVVTVMMAGAVDAGPAIPLPGNADIDRI
jgi:DNA-binding CsgD family transcriptional regulator